MIFSKKCEYAIRALTHLAGAAEVCDAREISRDQKVPYPFMAKVLQELQRKGFLNSVKGAGGGFTLAKPPYRIRLIDVLKAIDGDEILSRCLYGFSRCSDSGPCPLHEDWKSLRGDIESYLRKHTLAQLATRAAVKPEGKGKKRVAPAGVGILS